MDSTTPRSQRPLKPIPRAILVAETIARYVWVRHLARSRSLPEALTAIRQRASRRRLLPTITADPYRLSFIVQRVLRRLPTDTRCLMQSLTLLAMVAGRGGDATVVISTRSQAGFAAHAWLEIDKRPLLPPEPAEFRLVEL